VVRRFSRYVWTSGFVAGFIVIAVLGVFYPGDAVGKAIALSVSSAAVLALLLLRFIMDGSPDERGPSSGASIRLGTAEMPTDRELARDIVVGVLASGEHRRRHFAAGTSADGESWFVIVSGYYPYRVKYATENTTQGAIRRQLRTWDARIVRETEYRELLKAKYFGIG
jgi:hypothetical protein